MRYQVVCGGNIDSLEDEVKKQLQAGWEPIGGVSLGHVPPAGGSVLIATDARVVEYFQAMIHRSTY